MKLVLARAVASIALAQLSVGTISGDILNNKGLTVLTVKTSLQLTGHRSRKRRHGRRLSHELPVFDIAFVCWHYFLGRTPLPLLLLEVEWSIVVSHFGQWVGQSECSFLLASVTGPEVVTYLKQ